MERKLAKYGFIQMFQLEAETAEEAELIVVKKIKENEELIEMTQNTKEDSPIILLEELQEIVEFIEDLDSNSGRIWYQEKRWWQFWK